MSISSELLTLNNTKTAIRTAINNKGGSVGASDTFASYATAIDNLPSGGDNSTLIDLIEGNITTLTIPSGTTSIRNSAFQNLTSLTSVTITSGVTTIGNSAFSGCGITSVTIPSGVTSIGTSAFQYSTGLTSVTIPNTVSSIESYTFNGCSSLTSVTIPNTVTYFGPSSFHNCSSLTSVTIPSGTTVIANNAFKGCGLTSLTIPSSVTTIGNTTFNACSSLTFITVNATTPPSLGSSVFNNTNDCPIYVPSESVAAYKAATNWSTYESRIYPIQQVATVDNTPVYNYDLGMTSTTMITSTNMQKMPTGTSLELAEGIVDAGGSFGNYTSITLPSTFSSFDDQGMIGNTTTTLTCLATTPPTAERNDIGGANLTAIYVPAANVADYQANATWSSFSSIIQAISA